MSTFQYKFLFKQLVKRDYKKRYKGTVLGMLWSILYPLLDLAILVLIFKRLLGRDTPHYPIYVFCGTIIMSYFREATRDGMSSLRANRNIITKVKMPYYLFLISKNMSSLINFAITLCVFFILCIVDGINFSMMFVLLIFPIICLTIFNIGISLILSTCYVFFRDVAYIYDLMLIIINYLSATFYRIDSFGVKIKLLFLANPLFCYIEYFREVVLYNAIPSIGLHLLCLGYSILYLLIGIFVYKKNKKKFIYNL